MTGTAWPLLAVTAVAAGGIGYLAGYVIGLKSGHERGKFDAQMRYLPRIAALEKERAQFRIWRAQHRPPWAIEPPRRPAPPSRVPALVATGIAPVTVPQPAPRPATPAAGFAALTDTGAMRAIQAWGDEKVAVINAITTGDGE